MPTSLQLTLEPAGPRVRALEAALRSAIRDGRLDAGAQLPPSRALAEDLGLARATVTEAYAQLRAEGYITARPGSGTWVANLVLNGRPPPVTRSGPPTVRFTFDPGLPDLTAFPAAAWSRALRHGLRRAPAASLGYDDPRGRRELREALAAYLSRSRSVVADPELIVLCAGFSHALALLLRALRTRGVRTIAMEDPCLWWHRNIAATAGFEVVPIPVDGHGARTEVLRTADAGAALLAPAHQFPLGALLHPARRTEAVAWARSTEGLVIEDDYDAELRYDRPPVGALQPLDPDRVVYVGTASKTLAPGLRLAWMLVPPSLLEPLSQLRWAEDVHLPATEQIAFTQLLLSGDFERHMRRMRARYRARRDALLAMLAERVPGATVVGISAGLRVLLQLPPGSRSGDALAAEAASRSMYVFPLRPCYHGGVLPVGARDGLVLGYAAPAQHDFRLALEALGDLLATASSSGS